MSCLSALLRGKVSCRKMHTFKALIGCHRWASSMLSLGWGKAMTGHSPKIGNTSTNRRGTLMHGRMKRSSCGPRRVSDSSQLHQCDPGLAQEKPTANIMRVVTPMFHTQQSDNCNDSTSEMGANIYTGYLTCLPEKTRKSWIGDFSWILRCC